MKPYLFPQTIQDWNKIPGSVTDISDVKVFKAALHNSVAVNSVDTCLDFAFSANDLIVNDWLTKTKREIEI